MIVCEKEYNKMKNIPLLLKGSGLIFILLKVKTDKGLKKAEEFCLETLIANALAVWDHNSGR